MIEKLAHDKSALVREAAATGIGRLVGRTCTRLQSLAAITGACCALSVLSTKSASPWLGMAFTIDDDLLDPVRESAPPGYCIDVDGVQQLVRKLVDEDSSEHVQVSPCHHLCYTQEVAATVHHVAMTLHSTLHISELKTR